MYVRLAFAVAANLESEIMLVDEVLAVGDSQFQKKCLGKMEQVAANNGRTVLFVSHNAGAISALCSSGILLQSGRYAAGGEIRDVLRKYAADGSRELIEFVGDARKPCITSVAIDQKSLAHGDFILEVSFSSPFPLNPPIVGIVVSNSLGVPVFGSNPLMHPKGFSPKALTCGIARIQVPGLPVHPGEYCVTVFLGEAGLNYEIRRDVISFEFVPKTPVVNCPPIEGIGPLNVEARWQLQ
jgi:lipopolysaccharide transport system ATP-binding protein